MSEKILINSRGDTLDSEEWLWCLHCECFFQAKELKEDDIGGRQQCPFCDGAGCGFDIFPWNGFGDIGEAEHWPKKTGDLTSGMRSPLYPKNEESNK